MAFFVQDRGRVCAARSRNGTARFASLRPSLDSLGVADMWQYSGSMFDRRTAGGAALVAAALLVGSVPSERWRSWLLLSLGLLAFMFAMFCLFGDRRWHRPRLAIHSPHIEQRFRNKRLTLSMPTYAPTSYTTTSPNVVVESLGIPGFLKSGDLDDALHYAYVKVENVGYSGSPLATNVVATVVYREHGAKVATYTLHGRWSHASPIVTPQTLLRANEIELAPNGNAADLDIALMYDGEARLYASNDENIHHAANDLRHNELPVPCDVRVTVRGAGCSTVSSELVASVFNGELNLSIVPTVNWRRRLWLWLVTPEG